MLQPYSVEDPSASAAAVTALGLTLPAPPQAAAKSVPAKPAVAKQASAFPPNYIHSLDASHMMMTARACHDRGIAFAGVHDSFWTHAADVDTCRHQIRAQFVRLYAQPLLARLHADMQAALREAGSATELPPPPRVGELDLRAVLQSTYFFN